MNPSMEKHILITGASGFVGQAVAHYLIQQGKTVVCPSRRPLTWTHPLLSNPQIDGMTENTDWSSWLHQADAVIHCAARVHVMHETAADPMSLFRAVNVSATLALAQQAARAGVRQFIFISSVKVNGELTTAGHPFNETDPPQADDPYGISKQEAEQALLQLGQDTGMSITIIRPPLVYGPGVKANFLNMLRWVRKGIPLPFGSINNRRSFVYIGNLVDLITVCLRHPAARQQIFLVSDGRDLSTTELLQTCADAMHRPAHLLPVPASWLMAGAKFAGKTAMAERLCLSLQVDIGKANRLLNWTPPYSVEQGLAATVTSFPELC